MRFQKQSDDPPRLASAFVALLAHPSERAFLLGDLAEEFHEILVDRGGNHASRWYWSQVGRSAGPLLVARLTSTRVRQSTGAVLVGSLTAVAAATAFGILLEFLLRPRADATLGLIASVVTACALVSSTCGAAASTWVSGPRWTLVVIGTVVLAPDFVYATRSQTTNALDAFLPLCLAMVATCAGLALGGKLCRAIHPHT